jgi:Flp pilus assembly protein CpaB
MDDRRSVFRRLAFQRAIRTIGWHQRLLAAGLAAAAVALAIHAASPPRPDTVDVTVAGHDLAGGSTIHASDLSTIQVPPGALPDGLLNAEQITGHILAGPVHAGEPITDVRLLGSNLLAGWGKRIVATPVRLADSDAAAYLRQGYRINLLATSVDGIQPTVVVAADVPVLAVLPGQTSTTDGALLMVATSAEQAADLASAAVTSRLTYTLHE